MEEWQCVKQWETDNFQSSSKDKWLECTGVHWSPICNSKRFACICILFACISILFACICISFACICISFAHCTVFANLRDSVASGPSCVSTPLLELPGEKTPHLPTNISYRLFKITWSRFSPRSSSTRFVSFLKAFGWTSRILQYWTKIFWRLVISSWNNVTL